jgi:hypothetical protein
MKVPTQPPIDGLPLAWQIVISLIVGLATLAVALKGYFIRDGGKRSPSHLLPDSPATASIMAATIADMGAVRNLSDCVLRLDVSVQTLTKAIDESTHHERNNVEISREVCARLRELVEELERQGRDQREWDSRDEKRR